MTAFQTVKSIVESDCSIFQNLSFFNKNNENPIIVKITIYVSLVVKYNYTSVSLSKYFPIDSLLGYSLKSSTEIGCLR